MENTTISLPPVPVGYEHLFGTTETGFIIRRISDGSELVWIPVMSLEADGTLDGKSFDRPFGCRPYGYRRDNECGYGRRDDAVFSAQLESIEKYGGFYITRCPVSRDEHGALHSVKGAVPYTFINRRDAAEAARSFENAPGLGSHMPYAAEQDTVFAWLVQNSLLSADDIAAFGGARNTRDPHRTLGLTGSCGEKNGLFDVAANVDEWSQESYDGSFSWGCGSSCKWPGTSRCYYLPYACYTFTGFRAVLCID